MTDDFEFERDASREEAAALLGGIAEGIAAGSIRLDDGDRAVTARVAEDLELEVEFEADDGELELEVELEWDDPGEAAAPEAAGTAVGSSGEAGSDGAADPPTADEAADPPTADEEGEGTGEDAPAAAEDPETVPAAEEDWPGTLPSGSDADPAVGPGDDSGTGDETASADGGEEAPEDATASADGGEEAPEDATASADGSERAAADATVIGSNEAAVPADADPAIPPDPEGPALAGTEQVGAAGPAGSLGRFELFVDRGGKWRWRLVHRNGNVVATSGQGYTRKHNAVKGLRSVQGNAAGALVVEEPGE